MCVYECAVARVCVCAVARVYKCAVARVCVCVCVCVCVYERHYACIFLSTESLRNVVLLMHVHGLACILHYSAALKHTWKSHGGGMLFPLFFVNLAQCSDG